MAKDWQSVSRGVVVWTLMFGAAWAIGWAVGLGLVLIAFLALVAAQT